MQQQSWYVIQKKRQYGPFSTGEIRQMLDNGDIKKETVIQPFDLLTVDELERMGAFRPEPTIKPVPKEKIYQQIIRLAQQKKLDTLPLVQEQVEYRLNIQGQIAAGKQLMPSGKLLQEEERENTPPPVPAQALALTPPPIPHEALNIELDQIIRQTPQESSSSKRYFVVAALLLSLVLLPLLKEPEVVVARPASMTMKQFSQAQVIARQPLEQILMRPMLAQDLSQMWLVSNWPWSQQVALELSSIPTRTIGAKSVEVSASGLMEDKIAKLKDFTFTKGVDWAAGVYRFKVTALGDQNSDQAFPMPSYSGRVLVGFESKEAFKKALARDIKKRRVSQSDLWTQLELQYQTLSGMLGQIENLFQNVFQGERNLANWTENLAYFQQTYQANIGTLLTHMVLSQSKGKGQLQRKGAKGQQREELFREHQKLTQTAQAVGETAMGLLQDLELRSTFPSQKSQGQFLKHMKREFQIHRKSIQNSIVKLNLSK
jgi:hypothetical protein